MAHIERHQVSLTTAADGSVVGFSPTITGFVQAVRYVKDEVNGFADGVDFALTAEATGETIWSEQDVNASATRAPRQATHSTAGAAALFASGGAAVLAPIGMAADRIRIAVTNGGNAKIGTFIFIIG
ncbi:hypothetical protein [Falsiroseomonas sp.]|uniref:hypothetical protein n=1 Tax=Falsiroseomonas sp. TaxID=2870721 RepID=UPI002734D1BA|nr:hypothetical protein [Falsiroseomonas sp.]MDP3417858.1 hypothetical protein [Falsiroseomonas sp.]